MVCNCFYLPRIILLKESAIVYSPVVQSSEYKKGMSWLVLSVLDPLLQVYKGKACVLPSILSTNTNFQAML